MEVALGGWPQLVGLIRVSGVPVSTTETRFDPLAHARDRREDPILVSMVSRKHHIVTCASVSIAYTCGADSHTHRLKKTEASRTVLPQSFLLVGVLDETMEVNGISLSTRAVPQGIAAEPFRQRAH